MSNDVIYDFRTLRHVQDESVVNSILEKLIEIPVMEQQQYWIRDSDAGNVCIYSDERYPGKVLEYVQGSKEDSVTTLYEAHPIFNERTRLVEARKKIMNEIGSLLLSLPSVLTLWDAGRERQVRLAELGTMQLLDMVAYLTHRQMIGTNNV